jgi:DNA-binding transcriptional MerR regulator
MSAPGKAPEKAASAFWTIGELAAELGIPQHRLRYWEQRFPQLKPLQRAGLRRYYRPEDVTMVRRIDDLLHRQGYTISGVQRVLAEESRKTPAPSDTAAALFALRDLLVEALRRDAS